LAVLLLLALAFPAGLFAASFSISFDQNPVTVGDTVTMTMTFDGGQPNSLPAVPAVPGLKIDDAHSDSTAIEMVNGNVSRKIMHSFVVTPTGPGDFVIPSMEANIAGQVCKSDPVTLKVTKPGTPPPGMNAENPELAFMRLEVPKKTVYVGEVFHAELDLYLREGIVDLRDLQMNPPQAEGFTIGKSTRPPTHQTRLGNFRYIVVPFAMTYTAAKVGKLSISSTEAGMTLLFGPVDIFRRPSRAQHVTLSNEPVEIQSLPLPMENVPPGFSGAVGKYTMNLTVSPTNVAMGDPITIKVDITGTGGIDGVRLPTQMGWDRFKVYPPTAQFEANPNDPLGTSGTMHFALTAVPESMDVNELPPFLFTYFDPDSKSYQTLSHPVVPLIVRPSAASLPAPNLSENSSSDNPGSMQDVSPIKPRLGELAQLSPPLIRQPWFLMLQGIPAIAWASLLIARQQKEKLASNPRLRRRKQVEQTIRDGLKELRQSANAGDSETFFATVFRLLQEQLGERLDVPSSAITEAVLDERLRPLGVPETQLTELREIFQACNQARYAHESTNAQLVSMMARVEAALNELRRVKA
jgi:hypothetical protein